MSRVAFPQQRRWHLRHAGLHRGPIHWKRGVLKLADLTGDSKLDILVGVSRSDQQRLWNFHARSLDAVCDQRPFHRRRREWRQPRRRFRREQPVPGNGNGTFGAPMFFNDVQANAAQLVDVTGDNRADLVYTSGRLIGGTINVMPGNGDGTFGAKTTSKPAITRRCLAQINDSRLDAVTTGGTTGLSAFLGIPGGFGPSITSRSTPSTPCSPIGTPTGSSIWR